MFGHFANNFSANCSWCHLFLANPAHVSLLHEGVMQWCHEMDPFFGLHHCPQWPNGEGESSVQYVRLALLYYLQKQ